MFLSQIAGGKHDLAGKVKARRQFRLASRKREGTMMLDAELHLPKETLRLSTKRGNEYAWRVHDIPHVIDAAQKADLVNIGGQLQFWLPDGGICECYWIEVDTSAALSKPSSWQEKVVLSASIALDQFSALLSDYDFAAEGVRAFPTHLATLSGQRRELESLMHFAWYLRAQNSLNRIETI
ncbi:hypothetical protein [Rhizobium sp. Root483D2]|uniref:hypothetical protein n=1 Tax=Rhizobium sp. Root483D2 TaxID=1736545 RepID=UPI001AEC8C02|nr:hypothetical protein [Rhizobium sp. Root483D2]